MPTPRRLPRSASPSSRSAAPATRSTPRSWPAGWPRTAGSWSTTPTDADAVVVNTCGFVEAAKKDSVDTLLAAADLKADGGPRPSSRSAAWPSATATSWPTRCPRPTPCSASTTTPTSPTGCATCSPASGHAPHTPRDRRTLLPISPVDAARGARPTVTGCPGTAAGSGRVAPRAGWTAARSRRSSSPPAATGAARSARSRPSAARSSPGRPTDVLAEARWLAEQGVRELVLVSENSTSYGKDLGDLRLLETLLPELAAVDGHRAGPGLLPAAGRDAARRWSRRSPATAGVAPLLRPVLPARQRAGAAPDAPLRRHRRVPRAARPDPARWPRRPASAST